MHRGQMRFFQDFFIAVFKCAWAYKNIAAKNISVAFPTVESGKNCVQPGANGNVAARRFCFRGTYNQLGIFLLALKGPDSGNGLPYVD